MLTRTKQLLLAKKGSLGSVPNEPSLCLFYFLNNSSTHLDGNKKNPCLLLIMSRQGFFSLD